MNALEVLLKQRCFWKRSGGTRPGQGARDEILTPGCLQVGMFSWVLTLNFKK